MYLVQPAYIQYIFLYNFLKAIHFKSLKVFEFENRFKSFDNRITVG
jgi:hypothetical protein